MSFAIPVTVIDASDVENPSVGEAMTTRGGVVSSVAWILAVLAAPWAFVATAVIVLFPSINGTETEKPPDPEGAAIPLTVTAALGSSTVPVTLVGLMLRKLKLGGEVIVIVGAR